MNIAIGRKKEQNGMVQSNTIAGTLVNLIITLVVIALAFICIIPIWHVLMSSISDGFVLLSHEGLVIAPVGGVNLGGYRMIFRDASVISGYMNTIFYVVFTVGVGLVLNVVGGYAVSRDTKLSKAMTIFLMITMMFSGGMIPTYMVFSALGLVGNRWSIVLAEATMAVNIMIGANAFRSVPVSTVEAAQLDGTGHVRMMFQIMLPQCKSLFMVTILNSFVGSWNSWLTASIYVPGDKSKWPLQLIINELVAANANFLQNSSPNYDRHLIQFAVIIAATLPIIIAFPFFQKQLEAGVLQGAVKE